MFFIAATDLHLTSRAPEHRIDPDFPEELFELLEQLLRVAAHLKAQAILFPGDLFHDTAHTRVSMEVLSKFAGWCFAAKELGVDVLAIPGNHDLRHNRYDSLANTPLGLLFAIGAIHNVSFGGAKRYRLLDDTVIVRGVPYPDAFSLDAWQMAEPLAHRAQLIVLGHCFANLMPGEYYGEPVHGYVELLQASGADYIVLGHDHTDRGIHRFLGQTGPRWVLDQGAMFRGSVSDSDVNRVLKFAVIDTAAREVKEYRYEYRPAADILDLETVQQRAVEKQRIGAFVLQLQADLAAQASTTTVDQKLTAMTLAPEVRQRVEDYIAQAEAALP